jgi:hypothetical protein
LAIIGQPGPASGIQTESTDNNSFITVIHKKFARLSNLQTLDHSDSCFITISDDEGNSYRIYKVAGNIEDNQIPQFGYSPNIIQWKTNPEQALHNQGYYNPKSRKYNRAQQYASYSNDNDMRAHMLLYHTFPQTIDTYMQEYGQQKKILQPDRQNPTIIKKYLRITIPGEIVFRGIIQPGLFSYIY